MVNMCSPLFISVFLIILSSPYFPKLKRNSLHAGGCEGIKTFVIRFQLAIQKSRLRNLNF